VFWIGIPIGWHFLFQFLNTLSTYILNRVGDKLQPCLNPLVTLKPFVIRFPTFIFELDPLYNDFIASINLVLITNKHFKLKLTKMCMKYWIYWTPKELVNTRSLCWHQYYGQSHIQIFMRHLFEKWQFYFFYVNTYFHWRNSMWITEPE
jgi:hypothetical protein